MVSRSLVPRQRVRACYLLNNINGSEHKREGGPDMPEYKIRYKDSRAQKVRADLFVTREDFIYFVEDRATVYQIATSQVESVGLADVPDPEKP
jgi:hypothetical protein